MYYSEWILRYSIGFIIHERPITYKDFLGDKKGFYFLFRGPLSKKLNKRIRPKVQILKILGGSYRENLYVSGSIAEKETKFLTLNQKFTEEELVKVKAGVKSGKICIGKQQ
jgi:hypothetical protein